MQHMDLNIRNFPEDILKSLKLEAVETAKTLREVVIEKCSRGLYKPGDSDIYIDPRKLALPSDATKRPKSVRKGLNAGSVTTGTEEQGIVDEKCEHGFSRVKCLMCDWALRNGK